MSTNIECLKELKKAVAQLKKQPLSKEYLEERKQISEQMAKERKEIFESISMTREKFLQHFSI